MREKLIDRLLASPEHHRRLLLFFDEMLMERLPNKHVPAAEWRRFLLSAIRSNVPWNELAGRVLAADGSTEADRAAAKFLLEREGEQHRTTRDVGRLFFGVDLQCAQCHDHPLIPAYKQADYHGLRAFVVRTSLFTGKDKKVALAEKADGEANFESVFVPDDKEQAAEPRLPFGAYLDEPDGRQGKRIRRRPRQGRAVGADVQSALGTRPASRRRERAKPFAETS